MKVNLFKKEYYLIKKLNKHLKTYGFDHSAPHSIATQLFYTRGSPDILLVSGSNVKKCYSKFYNWSPKKFSFHILLDIKILINTIF